MILYDYKIMAETFNKLGKYYLAKRYYHDMVVVIKRRISQDRYDTNIELGSIYSKLASFNYYIGRIKKFLNYSKMAIRIYDKVYDIYNVKAAEVHYNVGTAYNFSGRYRLALREYQKALHIYQNVNGCYNEDVFKCFAVLGHTCFYLDKFEIAEKCFDKAIEIVQEIYPAESLKRRIFVNYCQGMIAITREDYDDSIELFKKVEQIIEQANGEYNEDFFIVYNNIGLAYQIRSSIKKDIDDVKKSLEYFVKAKNFQRDNPEFSNVFKAGLFHNMGNSYVYMADIKSYEKYFRKAIKAGEAIHGIGPGSLEKSYYQLWYLLLTSERYEEAEEIFGKLCDFSEKQHKKQKHPKMFYYKTAAELYTEKQNKEKYAKKYDKKYKRNLDSAIDKEIHVEITDLSYISRLYIELGDLDEAFKTVMNAKKLLNCDHSFKDKDFTAVYMLLGIIQEKKHDYKNAYKSYTKAQNSLDDSPLLKFDEKKKVEIHRGIGRVCYARHEYMKALSASTRAEKFISRTTSDRSPLKAAILHEVAIEYEGIRDYSRAVQCYEYMERVFLSVIGRENIWMAELYADMVVSYSCLGFYERAIEYGEYSLEIWKKMRTRMGDEFAAKVYDNLGNAYLCMNRSAKALKLFEQSLEIKNKLFGDKHLSTAITLNYKGKAYLAISEIDEAIKACTVAYEVFESEDRHKIIEACVTLAYAYIAKDDEETAAEYCQTALDYTSKLYSINSHELIHIYLDIAGPYKVFQDTKTVINSCYLSLSNLKEKFNDWFLPNHLEVCRIAAEVYEEKNDKEISALYEEAKKIIKKRYSDGKHILEYDLSLIYESIAKYKMKKGKFENAIKELKLAEEYLKERYQGKSPQLFRVYHQFTEAYAAANNKEKQLKYKGKLLKLIRAEPGKNSLNLAPEFLKLKDKDCLEAAVKGESREDLWDCPEMGEVYKKYAIEFKEDRKDALKKCIKIFKDIYGEGHKKVREVYELLENE